MRKLLLLLGLAASVSISWARPFSLVVYNVENLMDADGLAVYDDYQPGKYTPAHLVTKLTNISKVLSKVDKGAGPDIILFNEIEADRTPESGVSDVAEWLKKYDGKPFAELLTQKPLPGELAGVPSEVWLQKALYDANIRGYNVVNGDDKSDIAIKCVIFSRFPVKATRLHPTQSARPIVEAQLDVDGSTLYVFNNHWKSGAGDAKTEASRRANAKTLRTRIDEILATDPNADIVIGGDLNSQYNQKTRYKDMGTTGINDVLGSQGNEMEIRGKESSLYNLWYELPPAQRGSDIFKGEWGTLVHIIISRGLYDMSGVQYVDNSFTILKIPGVNMDTMGLPNRWKGEPSPGSGFSDHFPLLARFITVDDKRTDRWMTLVRPSTDEVSTVNKIDYAAGDVFKTALKVSDLPASANLRDGTYSGKIFYVSAKPTVTEKGHVQVKINGQDYDVFSHDKEIRDDLRDQAKTGKTLKFYGELGTFKGAWQFVVQGKEWVK